ncbi:MAG: hypothetical protein AAF458_05320 [Pseudomonadota bacterium]
MLNQTCANVTLRALTIRASRSAQGRRAEALAPGAMVGYYKLYTKAGEFVAALGAVPVDAGARIRRAVAGAVLPTPVLMPVAVRAASARPARALKRRSERPRRLQAP